MSHYAGGAECDTCGKTGLGVVDRFCRRCGSQLRELEAFETPTEELIEAYQEDTRR